MSKRLLKGIVTLLFVSVMLCGAPPAFSAPAATGATQKTVVLVHGAWADGSSWEKVIPLLQAKGLHVVSVQNPLTSLADDVAATKRAIAFQQGPVVLVGRSWAGTVITEAGTDPKVAALVYVAAFAPDPGQSTNDVAKQAAPPPGLSTVKPDGAGFVYQSDEGVAKNFAQDLPAAQTKVMAATQGPIAAKLFDDKVTHAAWKNKPSWFVVAKNDRMIQPDLERAMAKKINAKTTELPTSHVAMLVRPKDVAAVILAAVAAATPPMMGAAE
jgi:pimeloyl-ACP methyl ester carboxylesterase